MTSFGYAEIWASFIAFFSALGAFLFGLDIGYIAPILECPSFKRDVALLDSWSDPDSHIDDFTSGFIVGSFSVGAILTALPPLSGYMLDSWGRRPAIILGSAVFLVGCAIQAEALNVWMMILGRFIAGMSIGLLSSVVPLYQCELAPTSMRGCLTSLYQMMITFGIFIATFIDHGLVGKDDGWRVAIWIQCIPALGMLVVMPFLPRSPRWLAAHGDMDGALQSLRTVRSTECEANEELKSIVSSIEETGEFRWSSILDSYVMKLLGVGIVLQLLQQLVGMNALMYFGPRVFASTGKDATLFQTYLNLVNFLATFLAIFMADRCGRRWLLMLSSIGMAVACFVIAIAGSLLSGAQLTPWILFSSFFFVVNFAYGWGPMIWVYTSEMFPLHVRSYCASTTTCANWVGNFAIAQCTPMLLGVVGLRTFYVFGVFSLMSLAVAMWLPETKGIMLEEVDKLFRRKLGEGSLLKGQSLKSDYGTASKMCA